MNTVNFKNQPDQRASLLFLAPGLLLSIFYLYTIYSGEATGYILAALVGIIGFVMGFWKPLRWLRIWQSLVLGFGIGVVSFLVATISSPLWNLGLPALSEPPWPLVRAVITIAVALTTMGLLGYRLPHSRWLFWTVSGILLVNSLVTTFILAAPDSTFAIWNLSWRLGFSAAIMGTVFLGFQLSHQSGILALLAVIIAFGTLNAVNLTMADVAEGQSAYGQIALLLAYWVPLVIGPTWLLLGHSWRIKKCGVLLSWAAMFVGMVIILPVIDRFLEPHFFRYPLRLLDILTGAVLHGPLLIGLWLAFTLYEHTYHPPHR